MLFVLYFVLLTVAIMQKHAKIQKNNGICKSWRCFFLKITDFVNTFFSKLANVYYFLYLCAVDQSKDKRPLRSKTKAELQITNHKIQIL